MVCSRRIRARRRSLSFALAAGLAGSPAPAPGRDIDEAIDAGVEFLLREVAGPKGWTPEEKYPSGYAALQVYALVKCDVSFAHPALERGIAVMEEYKFDKVYSVSLYLMAYDAMVEQIEVDLSLGGGRAAGERGKFLDRMKAALDWLVEARIKGEGVWNYEAPLPNADMKTHRSDHSNTQFAVLALGVAAERKLRVPPEVWEEIADHFIRDQDRSGEEVAARPVFRTPESPRPEKAKPAEGGKAAPPGGKTVSRKDHPLYETRGKESLKVEARGWRYTRDDQQAPRFSMTCAGLSSLLVSHRHLSPARGSARGESMRRALRDGYGWVIGSLQSPNPFQKIHNLTYSLYSLEKVGDLGEVKAFGDFMWYEEGARRLLRVQRRDGGWHSDSEDGEEKAMARHATALALLFLSRATDLAGRARPLTRLTSSGGRLGGQAGGPAREAVEGDAANWLYLPSQKVEVPLVRLFRLFRYRPTQKVMKMVEEAVKVQDPERIHELVDPLCDALLRSPHTAVQSQARKLLAQATGADYPDAGPYGEWARRWAEVLRIGKEKKREEVERLREWLSASDGTPLKARVIWALERIGGKAAIPDLVQLLEAPDPRLREAAHSGLTFLSGHTLPFEARGGEKLRSEQCRAWKEWLAGEGN